MINLDDIRRQWIGQVGHTCLIFDDNNIYVRAKHFFLVI